MNFQSHHHTLMKTTESRLRAVSSFGHKNSVAVIFSGDIEATRELLSPKRDKWKLMCARGKENKSSTVIMSLKEQ